MRIPTELECLAVEIDTNYKRDQRGRLLRDRVPRLVPAPHVVIGAASRGRTLSLGASLPDEVAGELVEMLAADIGADIDVPDPAAPPPSADRCTELVTAAVGPVATVQAMCFLVHRDFAVPAGETDVTICTSETAGASALRPQLSEEHVDEDRGPWAAVVIDDVVVSICSTARSFGEGAEAGTWTKPPLRGRGLAASATVAWSRLLVRSGRFLFYSTDTSNRSSQGVAARLGLQSIGLMWKLVPADGNG